MKDKELQKYIGNKIREIRKSKKISQLDLAYSINMSMNTVSYIELGKIASKIDTLNKIANVLNVDISTFFPNKTNINQEDEVFKEITKKLKKLDNTKLLKINKILEII